MMTVKEKIDFFTWLGDYVEEQPDGKFYFRYDIIPEGTADENWDLFCDIQSTLREVGFELDDSYVEHDCITGYVVDYKEFNPSVA